MDDCALLVGAIVEKSGLPKEEVENKVEKKKESLGHLINDEVAIRLVARDLGIVIKEEKIDKPTIKIEDLVAGINNVTIRLMVERVGNVKEFNKKDGKQGRLARVSASDETGRINVCLWDDNVEKVATLKQGTQLIVHSAYTKPGLNGDIEIHLGNKAEIEIMEASPAPSGPKASEERKGRIWRMFDPISFSRKDGTPGRVIAFLLKMGDETLRVLVWDPSEELEMTLHEGLAIEVLGGTIRKDLRGELELHVNQIELIKIDPSDYVEMDFDVKRLSQIQPDMKDFNIEGTIDCDFTIETTVNGNNYARILIRDGETVLPITFWNGKAFQVRRMVKPGTAIRIEGCYTKLGPYGLEIGLNKWSRITNL